MTAANEFERGLPGTNARSDAEAAIEDLRKRGGIFVEAVRATRMAMALTDPTLPGNPIVFANQSFLRLSGYSLEEVLGQQPHFMNGPDTDPEDARRLREILEDDQDGVIETVQYAKDGRRFVATVLLSAFKDDDGQTLNHFLSWSDVTRRVDAEVDVADLRHTEAALRESERLRTAMLDVLPLGLGLTDREGGVKLSNREWARFIPTNRVPSRDPERGSRWRSWDGSGRPVDPNDYPAARALRGERVHPPMEFLHTQDDGTEVWTSVAAVPLRDGADEVIGAVCVIQNIDVAKRAAEGLRESEERFRKIVESATDYAILVTDPDDIIVDWMPGAAAVFGWSREEALGRPAGITFTPEDQAQGQPEKELATAAREGLAPDVRWHRRKDGSLVFIEGTVSPLHSEDGSIRGFLKIGQDVTERRNAQELLEASERRMRTLVTGIPQLVFRSEGDGYRIWGSPQWIEYTGLSFEESVGFGWLERVHPEERQKTRDAWEGVEDRDEYYCEHRIYHAASGEYRWHQTRATPSRDDRGRIVEWLGTSTEVEELRGLHRRQQLLVAELQHRVRNLLAMIRSIGRRTAASAESVDDYAHHLEGRISAMARTQALLTREIGRGVDLQNLVLDELEAQAAAPARYRLSGPDVDLSPKAAEMLTLAVHELATNSIKYGALAQADGRIAVAWAIEDGEAGPRPWLRFTWTEHGVGMEEGPRRHGFGTELITGRVPYELKGEGSMDFRETGLAAEIRFPLGNEGSILQTDAGDAA